MARIRLIMFLLAAISLAPEWVAARQPGYRPDIPDTILVKGDHYYPPYEFINEQGAPDGFNVELFEALARDLGLIYKLELGPWSQVREELEAGRIHVIMGLMSSPGRAEKMDFGIPHSVMTQGIFARKGDHYASLDDLRGREVVVQDKDLMHDILLETGLAGEIIPVTDQLEALMLLEQGQHDAAILGNFQGAYLIRRHGLRNVVLQTSNLEPRKYGMAVRKGDAELLALLNLGIYQLKVSGEYDRLYTKWFSVYEERDFWKEYGPYLLILGVVVAGLALFNLLLRRQAKRITAKLRESESRYSNVFKNNHAVMLLVDPDDGRIVDANPAAEKFYGWPREELLEMFMHQINTLPPEAVQAEIRKARDQQKDRFRFRHRLAGGEVRDVEVFSGRIPFGGKALLYSIVNDVTDQIKAEQTIRKRTEELSTLLSVSQALAVTNDLGRVFQTIVEQAVGLLKLETAAIYLLEEDMLYLGATTPALPPDFPEKLRKAPLRDHPMIEKTLSSKQPLRIFEMVDEVLTEAERQIQQVRGIRSMLMVPLAVESRVAGVLVVGTQKSTRHFSDHEITLYQTIAPQAALVIENARLYKKSLLYASELEERVSQRTAQLEASNKELEAFAYSVSHDLRAPLRAIDGFTRILLEDYREDMDQEGQRVCRVITENAQKMGQLIDDLLSFSRLGRSELQWYEIDMAKMAHMVFHELSQGMDKGRIEFLTDPLPVVQGDPTMMKQVWSNLIGNALKFTAREAKARIRIHAQENDGQPVFVVEDNGVGFDGQYAERIFGVFQRLHPEREFPGTGVGLAIVQRIIHRHGGAVRAEGEPGKGAKFFFSVPVR